jgi:circadian clock protein KaiC
MTQRVATGIKGLDKQIEGGIPKGSVVLISGAPGTGKTILAMQFLEAGMKKGEKCAYVTIEEPPEKIKRQAGQFGFFKKEPEMISARDIKYDIGAKKPEAIEDKIKLILEKLSKKKPSRVVIDSLSSLNIEDGLQSRLVIRQVFEGLNKLGITAVVTSEMSKESDWYSRDTVSEFLADGIFVLTTIPGEEAFRTLFIPKMRETKQGTGIYSMSITKKGIVVTLD